MKNILFIENELNNDNPMSTCYKLKCDRIKNFNNILKIFIFYNVYYLIFSSLI